MNAPAGTISPAFSRRRFIGLGAMAAATAALTSCSTGAATSGTSLKLWNATFDTVATTSSTTKKAADFWLTGAVQRFQKASGAKITLGDLTRDDKMFTKMRTAGVARNGPDVATIWSGAYTFGIKDFLAPLDAHYPASARKSMVGWSAVTEGFQEGKGKIYGVPCGVDGLSAMYFNRKVLDGAGVQVDPSHVQTWGEFMDMLGRIKASGVTPLALGSYEYLAFSLFYWIAQVVGGDAGIAALGSGKRNFSTPEVKSVVEHWLQLVPYTAEGAAVMSGGDATGKVVAGQAAATFSGSWLVSDLRKGLGDAVAMTKLPDVEGATSSKGTGIGGPGNAFVVSAYSKNIDAAVEFINFLCTPAEQIRRGKLTEPPMPNVAGLNPASVYTDRLLQTQAEWANQKFVFWADNVWPTALVSELFAQAQLAWTGSLSAAGFLEKIDAKRDELLRA